ncbi:MULTISPECIES: helix-turn-helix domain-containing protein [Streptomyces]|uniref:HTH-type transcriptional regulator MalT n=1 Tax=Streptomyces griseofuscus TaxID=146922 RepID=A0A7H1PQZ3_9ACTN|nr:MULTISPECIES: helix-turn-helix transcriptional regulator [Streptomyces]MBA9050434.1 DNA-binding CsgD family transcriptional regulator [Streptomyces murinus]QNT90473.1 HTH-type transcriptional regulator MalT [Streptomyces griseofuscus]BBC91335.1 LuxR family transcriptional regulator [Streptomyces rochei]
MPDEEELCCQEIACSLRALVRDVNEIVRLLQILVQERQPGSDSSVPESLLPDNRIESLTDRENEVFHLLVTGMSNRQIGRTLGIAERTVKNNLHSVYRKFGVTGRAEAIAQYFGAPVGHPRSSG